MTRSDFPSPSKSAEASSHGSDGIGANSSSEGTMHNRAKPTRATKFDTTQFASSGDNGKCRCFWQTCRRGAFLNHLGGKITVDVDDDVGRIACKHCNRSAPTARRSLATNAFFIFWSRLRWLPRMFRKRESYRR